jgi:LPXTG-motif cell wall-anchored protein
MIKRLITVLLGASLAVAMSAGAASAKPASAAEELAAAKAKVSAAVDHAALAGAKAEAKAEARAQEPTDSAGEGEGEGGGEEEKCLDPTSEEGQQVVNELSDKAFEAAAKLYLTDPALLALDLKLAGEDGTGGARGRYLKALEAATTPAQVEAAYRAYVAAIRAWNAGYKARLDQLKPKFAKIGEALLAGLAKKNICPDFIETVKADLDGGQLFVDIYKALTDALTNGVHDGDIDIEGLLEDAKSLRDQRLKELASVAPRPDLPITPPANGPSLPDTGASAIPMLLGGLALISGGSTALLIARRRRAAA